MIMLPERWWHKMKKKRMKQFLGTMPEKAYKDVLEIYNTEAMKKKYIDFYRNIGV